MGNLDILEHNRAAWNRECRAGGRWSIPVDGVAIARARAGDCQVVLTPDRIVPPDWLGDLRGLQVLCLASAGGQQAPLLAAAGAVVTSFDLSDAQLANDAAVAQREGLALRTLRGDMADLSMLPDAAFDLVFHPVSNVFVPDPAPVWRGCARVLRPGGTLLAGIMNPAFFLFDHDEAARTGKLEVRFRLPYREDDGDARGSQLTPERTAQIQAGDQVQFSHSLQSQVGGLLEAGFVLTGLYEDHWQGAGTPLDGFMPSSIALRARREGP